MQTGYQLMPAAGGHHRLQTHLQAERETGWYGLEVLLPYELLAQLYSHRRDKAQFAAVAKALKRRFPRHKNTWLVLGNGYARFAMHDKALAAYRGGLLFFPKDVQLWTNLAWELLRSPHPSKETRRKALKAARRAVKLSGKSDFIALDTLSQALWQTGQRDEARRIQRAAIALAQTRQGALKKASSSLRHQSLTLALARMRRRLKRYAAPRPPTRRRATAPTPQPPPRPAQQPAQRPISRPSSQAASLPAFRPLPRMFSRPAPIPRDPRHRRSRKLLLPE